MKQTAVQFGSVQSLSHVWLFATPRTVALQASPHEHYEKTLVTKNKKVFALGRGGGRN